MSSTYLILVCELSPSQKINAFNKDITALVKAQETVSGGGSWLFTNLRKEFLNWDNYIEEHFKKKVSVHLDWCTWHFSNLNLIATGKKKVLPIVQGQGTRR